MLLRQLSNPYESIQLDSSHNLRIAFGGTEVYIFENNGTFQPQISVNAPYPMCGAHRGLGKLPVLNTVLTIILTQVGMQLTIGLAKQLKTIKEQRTHPKTGEKFELDVLAAIVSNSWRMKMVSTAATMLRTLCCVKALVEKIKSWKINYPKAEP